MKYDLQLDHDEVDNIVATYLRDQYDSLFDPNIPVFSYDKKVEEKELKKLRKAIERVHNFITTEEQWIGDDR